VYQTVQNSVEFIELYLVLTVNYVQDIRRYYEELRMIKNGISQSVRKTAYCQLLGKVRQNKFTFCLSELWRIKLLNGVSTFWVVLWSIRMETRDILTGHTQTGINLVVT
jgi:hypothetical protein